MTPVEFHEKADRLVFAAGGGGAGRCAVLAAACCYLSKHPDMPKPARLELHRLSHLYAAQGRQERANEHLLRERIGSMVADQICNRMGVLVK